MCYGHWYAVLAGIGWFLDRLDIVLLVVGKLTLRAITAEHRDSEACFDFLASRLSISSFDLFELKLLQILKARSLASGRIFVAR